jgi:hypothetical protein
VLALVALAGGAPPAGAAEVLRVDDGRVTRVEDRYLPPASASALPPAPGAALSAPRQGGARTAATGPTVATALARAAAARRISAEQRDEFLAIYRQARSARARAPRAVRPQLADVIAQLEGMTRRGALSAGRIPVLFLQLERNTQFWAKRTTLPAKNARVVFAGSPLVFQYYPARGLQIQPQGTLGKANGMARACQRTPATCPRESLRQLLDWLAASASARGGFTAWEYFFPIYGGSAPWVSGLAQGTALQALARGSQVLSDPSLLEVARGGLGAFEKAPPVGIRKAKSGGAHYLLYSFSSRLEVLNGFLQAITGLYDFAAIAGDARARRLFDAGDRVARRDVPRFDTGDWSLYSRPGTRSDLSYHILVRDFLRNLCERTAAPVYCDTAARFTSYLNVRRRPTGPERTDAGKPQAPPRGTTSKWRIEVRRDGDRRRLDFAPRR